MSTLRSLLSTCYDHLFAPSCAFDSHSGGFCEALAGPVPFGEMDEYHNAYGVMADPLSPVEMVPVFESWDWSSQNSFE